MTGIRPTRLLAACLALAWLFAFAGAARGQNSRAYTEAPLPQPEGFYKYVTDNANVLDAGTKERLATILNRLKERADIEFAVVTVPTTGDEDIFEYSLKLARGWGIGSKEGEKNGLLLVVAVNDRKWRVQVSRHLEGDLTDSRAGEIARQRLVPQFRQNNYGQGISDFVQATVATLAERRGFQIEGIDQSYAYREPVRRTRTTRAREASGIGIGTCCVIIVVVVILFSLAGRGRGGRGGRGGGGWGGGGGGWLSSILIANAIGSVLSSGRQSSSGWGGGGGSGWGGGGGDSGGFGGFGGGGDFGGGGAGGDW